jgi:hypothetical protein
MAEGLARLNKSEARAVATLLFERTEARLLEASTQFQDIVFELEWRLRDYLHLKPEQKKARLEAERLIRARNAEGHRLHLEIAELEARRQRLAPCVRISSPPDLMPGLFRHLLNGSSSPDTAPWQTLAAATLTVLTRRTPELLPKEMRGRFNKLAD